MYGCGACSFAADGLPAVQRLDDPPNRQNSQWCDSRGRLGSADHGSIDRRRFRLSITAGHFRLPGTNGSGEPTLPEHAAGDKSILIPASTISQIGIIGPGGRRQRRAHPGGSNAGRNYFCNIITICYEVFCLLCTAMRTAGSIAVDDRNRFRPDRSCDIFPKLPCSRTGLPNF